MLQNVDFLTKNTKITRFARLLLGAQDDGKDHCEMQIKLDVDLSELAHTSELFVSLPQTRPTSGLAAWRSL